MDKEKQMAMTPKEKAKLKKELKPLKEGGNKASAKENLIQDITNRFRVTAREARDIVTAAGTVFAAKTPSQISAAQKNALRQVAETGKAAVTGKSGTTSDKATVKMYKDKPNTYSSGYKR